MRLTRDEQGAVAQATAAPLGPDERYVVIGPYVWGAGETVEVALKNAKSNRVKAYEGKAGWRFILYVAHKAVQVEDTFGGFQWDPTVTGTTDMDTPYREIYRSPKMER